MRFCAIRIIPADSFRRSRRKIISIRTMPVIKRWRTRSTSLSSNSTSRRAVLRHLLQGPVNVHSIRNSNEFQIVRRKDFPFRVVYLHSKGFSGALVQNQKTFLAAGEQITSSPLAQSNDDREQLPAFLGQGIFPVGTAVRSRHLLHDSARNQLLEARAQDVLCQPQALLKIGEAPYAGDGVTDDEQRPPFADGVQRACHGARVGFEGLVSHSSS